MSASSIVLRVLAQDNAVDISDLVMEMIWLKYILLIIDRKTW